MIRTITLDPIEISLMLVGDSIEVYVGDREYQSCKVTAFDLAEDFVYMNAVHGKVSLCDAEAREEAAVMIDGLEAAIKLLKDSISV